MENMWERFNNIAKAEEVVETRSQIKPIEPGKYIAKLEEIEAGTSQGGLPMLKTKFRTYENKVVYYNIFLQNANSEKATRYNIAKATNFIEDVLGEDIEFTTLGELGEIVAGIETGMDYEIVVTFDDERDADHKYPQVRIVSTVATF